MHVLFVEPRFPTNQRQFVRGLAEAGARVTGIGEAPVEALGPDLHRVLSGDEQVPNVCDEQRLYDAVPRLWRPWVFSDRVDTLLRKHRHGDASGVRGAAWLWPVDAAGQPQG